MPASRLTESTAVARGNSRVSQCFSRGLATKKCPRRWYELGRRAVVWPLSVSSENFRKTHWPGSRHQLSVRPLGGSCESNRTCRSCHDRCLDTVLNFSLYYLLSVALCGRSNLYVHPRNQDDSQTRGVLVWTPFCRIPDAIYRRLL